MNSELKQDFEAAQIKHLLFKSKLRSFLYGTNLAEGPIRDPEQCTLGIWIKARRQSPQGNLPEWNELDRLHRQAHEEANRLMDMRLQGHDEAAREGLSDMAYLLNRIPVLLRTLEDRLRTGR